MLHWVSFAMGLLAAPAIANDAEPAAPQPAFAAFQDPAAAMDEAEKKRQERLAALEASQSTKAARVVVLKWQGQETDYTHETLIRNVKTRIARPDAKFYPEVDLYQAGRKMPDKSVRPIDQLGTVPSSVIPTITSAVEEVSPIPWNAMTESEWGLKAHELRDLANGQAWFIDRPELREPLFLLYVQIGKAAENTNNPAPPFYEQVGGLTVNWYWYVAGAMGHVEPGLMSKLTDQDLYASVDYYKQMLDSGKIEPMTLAFEQEDQWDAKAFAGEYQVFINGLEVLIDDKDSLLKVPPGKVDVYLKRTDGHSLSESVDVVKLKDKIYFVRDVARKKMGIDFIDQLMEHPNECTPELDGDILNYLAIYARLHPDAEIYIAVPEGGNPNRILIWRWDRPSGTLQKVLDNTGGFPVRFAILGGTGMTFAGATVGVTEGEFDPTDPDPAAAAPTVDAGLTPNGIPFNLQLRGHYGRLLVLTGINGSYALSEAEGVDNPTWSDRYPVDDDGLAVDSQNKPLLKERKVNRTIYSGLGFVMSKDAAIGFGPRGYLQFGWTQVPNTYDITAHGGITTKGPLGGDGRVRSLIDVDGFVGAQIPTANSSYQGLDGTPFVLLGLVASIGLTF